jgi:UDP-GlcNAc:undecaprenyl-phosphate GlcNAc-1-phosphate transferase
MFAGDSGVQAMGFFLGAISILYNPVIQPQASSWFVPITLVAIPLFDVGLVVFSRVKHRRPIYKADLNHTYHRVLAKTGSHQRTIWLMDMGALFVGAVGLYALYQNPLISNSIFVGLLLTGVVLILVLAE